MMLPGKENGEFLGLELMEFSIDLIGLKNRGKVIENKENFPCASVDMCIGKKQRYNFYYTRCDMYIEKMVKNFPADNFQMLKRNR